MKRIIIYALSAMPFILVSCSQEEVVQNVNVSASTNVETVTTRSQVIDVPDFEVVNGYLKFQSAEDYVSMYNSLEGKNEDELISWSESNNYSSLFKFYKEEDSNE